FSEPVPDAAVVLGFDLGARFVRGAVCDRRGDVRARQDVELAGPDADTALEAIAALRESLMASAGIADELVDGVVVGVPGVVEGATGRVQLATNVPGLDGMDFGAELRRRIDLPVTLEN